MLKQALKAVGKSLLIVTGVSYGVVKGLDVLAQNTIEEAQGESDPVKVRETTVAANPVPDNTLRRLDTMDERLIRIEMGLANLNVPRATENFVTHAELTAALEQLSRRQDAEIDRRFQVQDRSVQSLRTMIARTDELLEQVIENIESMRLTA